MKPQTILDSYLFPTVFLESDNKRVIRAMEFYAEQEIEKFTHWTTSHKCPYAMGPETNTWKHLENNNIVSTIELYQIYKEG